MRELLIATRNKGKLAEMQAALADMPFKAVGVADVPAVEGFEPEETGKTFLENAILKATEYGAKANMLTIADDSGLEVDALGGEPGVRSARYIEGTDKDRYEYLLKKMETVPYEKRTARFVSVIAIFDPQKGKIETTDGECKGRITFIPKGEYGFGYDPIFYSDELGARFAELPMERKTQADHRGKALRKAKKVLLQFV